MPPEMGEISKLFSVSSVLRLTPRFRPTAVSLPIGCDLELMHVQHTLPKKELPQSDVDCLNLNIAVPAGTTPSSRLPVFLFIHGGGLVIGANSWPQFDYTRLVKLSVEKKLPVVAVSIKYEPNSWRRDSN